MNKKIKRLLTDFLKFFNLKLSFYDTNKPRYIKAIGHLGIDVIFDIGANEGQFAKEVLHNGFNGKIISFEPTSNIYTKLQKNSRNFPNWQVHKRVAVGEHCGTIMINVAGNSAASSSILPMSETHADSAPESNYISTENVDILTIDSVFSSYSSEKNKTLLKIDVQGYEDHVLTGALASLKEIYAVKLECSLVSLYDGDKTFDYYFAFFKKNGFQLFDIETGFANPITGQLLQFDAFFIRSL